MKVLSVAWSIYDSRIKEFANNCTGGGLAIEKICEYIGKREQSYLLLGKFKMPPMKLGNINIVGTCVDSCDNNMDSNTNANHLVELLDAFRNALDHILPDIVNFHGTGEFARMCMEVCIERRMPFVYTDHLYVGKHRAYAGYEQTQDWDDAILRLPDINIVAVSTGMRKKIMADYPEIKEDQIVTIANGTDFLPTVGESDFKKVYNLDGFKVLVCVGSIVERKNQLQLVKVIKILNKEIGKKIKILFCGKDRMEGKLQKEIKDNLLQDQLIYLGALTNDDMKEVYSVADGLIMPSFAEGLSIAALEAIACGIPIIMYKDSECTEDLNDFEVVCFAESRTEDAMVEAIKKWSVKDWNTNYIISYSKKFTMERVAEEYIQYYETILNH